MGKTEVDKKCNFPKDGLSFHVSFITLVCSNIYFSDQLGFNQLFDAIKKGVKHHD